LKNFSLSCGIQLETTSPGLKLEDSLVVGRVSLRGAALWVSEEGRKEGRKKERRKEGGRKEEYSKVC
jgi:hypothetical protein